MIVNLNTRPFFQKETKMPVSYKKTAYPKKFYEKTKCFFKSLNPKNWFSCFSEIDLDLNEFACKKNKINEKDTI